MKSDCKELQKKVDLINEMSKKEFIDLADGHVKDMNIQIAAKRNQYAAKPLVPVSFVRIWL